MTKRTLSAQDKSLGLGIQELSDWLAHTMTLIPSGVGSKVTVVSGIRGQVKQITVEWKEQG